MIHFGVRRKDLPGREKVHSACVCRRNLDGDSIKPKALSYCDDSRSTERVPPGSEMENSSHVKSH
jgi:hypothetical protein